MTDARSHSLWYKDAIIYELHVKAFFDSNDDGRGDFRGLVQKLDYLEELGVTAIWLLPFYPSPLRDDGYDIADYRGVHPDYGTLRDFRAFVREAHRRDMRVITELVVNHTSDQHRWFQAARRARPGSSRRNYYVWSDVDTRFSETRIIFTDTETSNWAWDPVAGAYYWHRFFSHQPDLNFDNPQVRRAIKRTLRYWLDMGVDGLRLDAVPYLVEREDTNNENLPETHEVIKELRAEVDRHYGDRMLLAEANQWPDDVRPYFGDGDECHMAFHFPVMPRIFMALRKEDRHPIVDILQNTPEIPDICQWALFLRNHDELTLEMVTDEERDYMYKEYANDSRMRINVGIRRRLAPLLENSFRRIELLNSLLFSFPGTPIVYYGDELGMGDNIFLGDRDGVRTPMQWTADRNAGFSRCDPARLYLPPVMDPVYGYESVNVEAQQRDPSSMLQFMRRMITLRRQHKAFGRGTIEFLRPRNRRILAYLRRWHNETILCVANLSRYVQPAEMDLREFEGWTPVEMFGHTEFPPIGELPYFLTLGPHAYFWFHLEPEAQPIRVHGAGAEVDALPSLTLEEGYDLLFAPEYRVTLLEDVVRPFLGRQRWFQGKAREAVGLQLDDWAKLGGGFYLAMVGVRYADDGHECYLLPLKLARGEAARRTLEEAPSGVLARVRTAEGEGVLFDALADRNACVLLHDAMADGRSYVTAQGHRLQAFSTRGIGPLERDISTIRRLSVEQSNTAVVVDDAFFLKLFRRIEDGLNPDLEIGRFLTERTAFRNLAPVAGGIEYRRRDAPDRSLAVLQAFVPNHGDGWTHLRGLLGDYVEACRDRRPDADLVPPGRTRLVDLARREPPEGIAGAAAASLAAARTLGRRTAEFHLALAGDPRNPDFAPVPMTAGYLRTLADELARHAQAVLGLLNARMKLLPEPAAGLANEVLSAGPALIRSFRALEKMEPGVRRIRIHGDLHLGQVLLVEDGDFILLDFEGEPLRSLADRRSKYSPLKDVAGMIRSFGYAAHSVHLESDAERPDPDRASWLHAWETWTSAAFLGAYLETAGDAPFLPRADADLQMLLGAFLIDKAFYELDYELNNRPDWLPIPLLGIRSIAVPGGGGKGGSQGGENPEADEDRG
ncbi:MAG: maltose alpha-D-glucosyltransferase [Acidobacteriota bacterium]|jgi:maltose alpha-D-glucosyltransferase/alpha-amylase